MSKSMPVTRSAWTLAACPCGWTMFNSISADGKRAPAFLRQSW